MSVAAMSMEQVQQRAGEQQQVRQGAERVPPMLAQEIEYANDSEQEHCDSGRSVESDWAHGLNRLRRNALPTTLTEDSAMAAAAMIGYRRRPKAG